MPSKASVRSLPVGQRAAAALLQIDSALEEASVNLGADAQVTLLYYLPVD